ncbi:MAG: hypothetical protein AB7E79_17140 [Rhodospirillaceae bacterium]
MNKQQLYTLGGALLASTALTSAANAMTFGRLLATAGSAGAAFSTSGFTIANTLFSTTAATANAVTITPSDTKVAARFSNQYNASTALGVAIAVEMIPTGAEFTSGTAVLGNVDFLVSSTTVTSYVSTVGAEIACTGSTGFGTSFVISGCTAAAGAANSGGGSAGASFSVNFTGLVFSGVTFTNASGLATAGSTVTMSGRIYNSQTLTNYEPTATSTIITSSAPLSVSVSPAANVTANASATPTAFINLSTTNGPNTSVTMDLVSIQFTTNNALLANLTTPASAADVASSVQVTVQSAVFSGAATSRVTIAAAASGTTTATVANFSGGAVTFTLVDADITSNATTTVRVVFNGTTAIPAAAAGTVTVAIAAEGTGQAPPSVTGTTASIAQGGFRAEVNTFNASTNGPFSSYLRIHNNGTNAGTVNIQVRSDDHTSGAILGSQFTTGTIQPGSTMQLSAAEIEGTETSTKLPSGGANVPTASRMGSYTLSITGALVGYVQHILFDGEVVADLSSFRNGANTNSAP